MANSNGHGHGGARAGSGRKKNSEKYAEQIASFHDQAARDLGDRYAALKYLADGGYPEEDVAETWEPAGLIQITKEVIADDGRSVNVRELAFPHLPPEQLVCVQRTVKRRRAAPDRLANEYLVNRLGGKPVQAIEGDLEITDPNAIIDRFETAVLKAYGDDESTEQDGGQ